MRFRRRMAHKAEWRTKGKAGGCRHRPLSPAPDVKPPGGGSGFAKSIEASGTGGTDRPQGLDAGVVPDCALGPRTDAHPDDESIDTLSVGRALIHGCGISANVAPICAGCCRSASRDLRKTGAIAATRAKQRVQRPCAARVSHHRKVQ